MGIICVSKISTRESNLDVVRIVIDPADTGCDLHIGSAGIHLVSIHAHVQRIICSLVVSKHITPAFTFSVLDGSGSHTSVVSDITSGCTLCRRILIGFFDEIRTRSVSGVIVVIHTGQPFSVDGIADGDKINRSVGEQTEAGSWLPAGIGV